MGGAGRQLLGRSHECALLDQLGEDVRCGRSRVLMVHGEAGIGKTALLAYLVESNSDLTVLRAAGVESEIELSYAGLHQLCAPVLDHTQKLPDPQRRALEVVFGLSEGAAPSRFLVGLAVLSLLSEAAEARRVLCVVDDAHWLDQNTLRTLVFVARRLTVEPIGIVFAAREPSHPSRELPELSLRGLRSADARSLLVSAARSRLDDQVVDRIVLETKGNPLALLELHDDLDTTELAGFAAPSATALNGALAGRFARQIAALPDESRQLLVIAAADPLGDPTVVWPAAALQGIEWQAGTPAEEAGLCEFGGRVRFRHPLVRSAAYLAATLAERRAAHAAIAEAMDERDDTDLSAWHRALAALGPDEEVAAELERSAARALARGGEPAAAAFLERSMDLTLEPSRRAARALVAAQAAYLAGAADAVVRLTEIAEHGPHDELRIACIAALRGKLAMVHRRAGQATPLLLDAARQLETLDRDAARDTYRDALIAAVYGGRFVRETGVPVVASAIQSSQLAGQDGAAPGELLEAAAILIDGGFAAGAPALDRALARFETTPRPPELALEWFFFAARMAPVVWDEQRTDALGILFLELVREAGALSLLPAAMALRVGWVLFAGDLAAAEGYVEEQDAVQDAIGGERSPGSRIALAAFRGRESEVAMIDEACTDEAVARGDGQFVTLRHWATAVLCNGLGRYEQALDAARLGASNPPDMSVSNWAASELVEASARSGHPDEAGDALARLAEMADACRSHWILGLESRARALVAEGNTADKLYCRAIGHLQKTRLRTELARAHLLYGEWLRREGRRVEARDHLRPAHEMFASAGMEAFAERASRELHATGEKPRSRSVDKRDDLTPQERQIAELARDGLSNPEIAARLFLSPRTVEWHLGKVFTKLGLASRHQLAALGTDLSARDPVT